MLPILVGNWGPAGTGGDQRHIGSSWQKGFQGPAGCHVAAVGLEAAWEAGPGSLTHQPRLALPWSRRGVPWGGLVSAGRTGSLPRGLTSAPFLNCRGGAVLTGGRWEAGGAPCPPRARQGHREVGDPARRWGWEPRAPLLKTGVLVSVVRGLGAACRFRPWGERAGGHSGQAGHQGCWRPRGSGGSCDRRRAPEDRGPPVSLVLDLGISSVPPVLGGPRLACPGEARIMEDARGPDTNHGGCPGAQEVTDPPRSVSDVPGSSPPGLPPPGPRSQALR